MPEGSNLEDAECFANELLGDLSLDPDLPCVDGGDPNADCGDEPRAEVDSCRLDMGHLAGTAEAQSRPPN